MTGTHTSQSELAEDKEVLSMLRVVLLCLSLVPLACGPKGNTLTFFRSAADCDKLLNSVPLSETNTSGVLCLQMMRFRNALAIVVADFSRMEVSSQNREKFFMKTSRYQLLEVEVGNLENLMIAWCLGIS